MTTLYDLARSRRPAISRDGGAEDPGERLDDERCRVCTAAQCLYMLGFCVEMSTSVRACERQIPKLSASFSTGFLSAKSSVIYSTVVNV